MYFMPGQKMPLLGYDYFGYYDKTKHQVYPYRDHLKRDVRFDLVGEIKERVSEDFVETRTAPFKYISMEPLDCAIRPSLKIDISDV